jgi:hypothetical protein
MLQTVIRLRRRRPDSNRFVTALRRGASWPLLQAGQLAHVVLSKALLTSCEVALEYMLGLTYSPQVGPYHTPLSVAVSAAAPPYSPASAANVHGSSTRLDQRIISFQFLVARGCMFAIFRLRGCS